MDSGQHAVEPQRGLAQSLLEILIMIALIFGLTWLMRTFIFEAYEIPSGSMETTIMTGDMVLAEKISYYASEPKQGDIVTFEDPGKEDRTLIKRCIAVAGQTVTLENGKVCVDGVALDEPYTHGLPSYELHSQVVTYPYTVPQGCIWVMGDNRTSSQDSRYFGAIPVSDVKSKAFAIYWPIDHIGMLNE